MRRLTRILILILLGETLTGLAFFFCQWNTIEIYSESSSPREKPVRLILVGDVMLTRGVEYQINKEKADFTFPFLKVAEELKKAGLVVGSHPHVVQNQEIYQGKPIFYSLGNFVFDQAFSESTMQGGLLRVYLEKKSVKKTVLEKVKINDSFQPEVVNKK